MKKQLLGAIILAFTLFACSDPKAANNSNFEQVINNYLLENKDALTCTSFRDKFPFKDITGLRKKHLQKYVDLGLLTEETEVKIHKGAFMGEDLKVETITYDLTELGKEHFTNGKFCFGTPKLEKIIDFMEPKDFMGQKVTKVNYIIKLENLPEWYKIDTTTTRKIDLRLMNDGWTYK
ncbi:hypothetical protein FE243_07010 [Aliarcobacter thereius]|uniref:Lipoprotein n=1 Tax=Aliarcobacter thereius TaxID=544718 RepID=A0A5R9GZ49_9BACT|nr:hypothetical protein [Aliarcobacter thereius]TLS71039.1 hypothetical protein FE246_08735 [Aliarcobacter thereius]TLT06643.1 hypothetical protein FE243_07010 [Aliarcobacter thereius]